MNNVSGKFQANVSECYRFKKHFGKYFVLLDFGKNSAPRVLVSKDQILPSVRACPAPTKSVERPSLTLSEVLDQGHQDPSRSIILHRVVWIREQMLILNILRNLFQKNLEN